MRRATMAIFAIIALIAIFFSTTVQATEEPPKDFDIRTFLTYTTDHFVITKATMGTDGSSITETDAVRKLFVTVQNETSTLIINSFKNDTKTGEINDKEEFLYEFDLNNSNSGVKKGGQNNDDKIFNFDFRMVNNVAISTGIYNIATGETYQWSIPTHDRWIFTVYNKNGQMKEILVATKIFIDVEKTFFQKYGTYIMMFGLMGLNMWVQTKTKNMQQRQAEDAARGVAGTTDDEFVDGGDNKEKKAIVNSTQGKTQEKKQKEQKQQKQQQKNPQSKKED